MDKSESIKELATALSKAQGEFTAAKKDGTNPHLKSRYATLDSVWDTCRDTLAKHGLSLSQIPEEDDPAVLRMTTMLMHSSGEWISGACRIPLVKSDPQSYGSACTYARRYTMSAFLGITSDDDADGHTDQSSYGNSGGYRGDKAPAPRREAPQAARAPEQASEVADGPPACAECGFALTVGQAAISRNKFGKNLCPSHQAALKEGAAA